MTHLDLCTGIGGFHLAAEWAGFETIGFSEVEPYCCKLLAQKWPEIKNYGDLRTADFSLARGCTVLSAGVPCQPASLAGKRRGKDDDRWLWPAVLDVVGSVQPAWCIFENPPGILTLDEFGGVLLRLGETGYEVRMFSVPANSVGAKHRRQRVFIVGNRNCANVWAERAHGERVQYAGEDEFVANAECPRCDRWQSDPVRSECDGRSEQSERCGETLENPECNGRQREIRTGLHSVQGRKDQPACRPVFPRITQSPIRGRTDGIRNRSHRIKALGNAVVPQQAYPFFEAIAQVERNLTE